MILRTESELHLTMSRIWRTVWSTNPYMGNKKKIQQLVLCKRCALEALHKRRYAKALQISWCVKQARRRPFDSSGKHESRAVVSHAPLAETHVANVAAGQRLNVCRDTDEMRHECKHHNSVISHVRMWVDTLSMHISAQMSVCMRVCWCQRSHVFRNICQSISQTKSQHRYVRTTDSLSQIMSAHTAAHRSTYSTAKMSAAAVQRHSKITEVVPSLTNTSWLIAVDRGIQKISLKMTIN